MCGLHLLHACNSILQEQLMLQIAAIVLCFQALLLRLEPHFPLILTILLTQELWMLVGHLP